MLKKFIMKIEFINHLEQMVPLEQLVHLDVQIVCLIVNLLLHSKATFITKWVKVKMMNNIV